MTQPILKLEIFDQLDKTLHVNDFNSGLFLIESFLVNGSGFLSAHVVGVGVEKSLVETFMFFDVLLILQDFPFFFVLFLVVEHLGHFFRFLLPRLDLEHGTRRDHAARVSC